MAYKIDDWSVWTKEYKSDNNLLDETIFSIGNGYIGMRGNFEEGYENDQIDTIKGTYLNGFYETHSIKYGEAAYGFARKSETMLNVSDSKIIKVVIEDEEFNMFIGNMEEYEMKLDFRRGVLYRDLIWESPKGRRIRINITRLVSLNTKHIAAIKYDIVPLNFSGKISIVSALDGDVENQKESKDPRVGSGLEGKSLKFIDIDRDNDFTSITHRTNETELTLLSAMENELITESEYRKIEAENDEYLYTLYDIKAKKGRKIILNKYITYYTSLDFTEETLNQKAKEKLNFTRENGFDTLLKEQKEYLKEYWDNVDFLIKGDKKLQQGIRYNMFQLLQSVGKDGKTNIPAKGLTGEGYQGHYFWDTEIYIFPFFLYTNPELAKRLLEYRYSILPQARERARDLGHSKGVLYPWRTISGEESSAYYPASTAQYHINADIIYALKKYVEVTGDKTFLVSFGSEMAFETARLWEELGDYIEKKDNKFCINGVTGPDEYTAIVNNNFYTNHMAKMNLEFAYNIAIDMKKNHKKEYDRISKKINLKEEEIENWKKAGENMYLPYDEELRIHPQDDSFLQKAKWDFENREKDKYPLLMYYHPLVIYRYQVIKQADTILTLFLLSDKFTLEDKKRDYDYYDKITTHDSSLSMCIYSIIANEIGYDKKSYDYFSETARMDLDNIYKNTENGIHTASMAGTWMSIVYGFAGMRVNDGKLIFKPTLPEKWETYTFTINFKKSKLKVTVEKDVVEYYLIKGNSIKLNHYGEEIRLSLNEIKKVKY